MPELRRTWIWRILLPVRQMRRLTYQEAPGSAVMEFFYENDDELFAMVRDCLERPYVKLTVTSCTCGVSCCTIHQTHTTPHMGCILR